jgi:hypothetical protein
MNPTLTVCVILKESMYSHTTISLLGYINEGKTILNYHIVQKMIVCCSSVYIEKSIALMEWYSSASFDDLFLFIDANQLFTKNDIIRSINIMKNKAVNVVCGAYIHNDNTDSYKSICKDTFINDKEGYLIHGSTGFMLIDKTILSGMDLKPVYINEKYPVIIPFFQPRVVVENINDAVRNILLPEDYSFCWLVKYFKGEIYGFISNTLGNIVYEHKYIIN